MPFGDNYETEAQELKAVMRPLITNADVFVSVKVDHMDYQFEARAKSTLPGWNAEVVWMSPSLDGLRGPVDLNFLGRWMARELIRELGDKAFASQAEFSRKEVWGHGLYLQS